MRSWTNPESSNGTSWRNVLAALKRTLGTGSADIYAARTHHARHRDRHPNHRPNQHAMGKAARAWRVVPARRVRGAARQGGRDGGWHARVWDNRRESGAGIAHLQHERQHCGHDQLGTKDRGQPRDRIQHRHAVEIVAVRGCSEHLHARVNGTSQRLLLTRTEPPAAADRPATAKWPLRPPARQLPRARVRRRRRASSPVAADDSGPIRPRTPRSIGANWRWQPRGWRTHNRATS